MLSANDVKEQLSVAYVQAVAARAGFSVERVLVDRDSVDLKVCGRGWMGGGATLSSPELGIQLKATSRPVDLAGGTERFSFALSRKNYNDLVRATLVPRILVVVVMPESEAEWLTLTPEALTLRRCAYWKSLRGAAPTENGTGQAVHLSRARSFTHESLRELLGKVSREEELDA